MNNFFARKKENTTVVPPAPPTQKRQMFMRLSLKEQILFIKRLSTLIKSGIPLLTALNMVRGQSKSRTWKIIMDSVIKDAENGQYLATSLGKFRKIFGELTINIIEIGEVSGTLAENLEYLADELKKKQVLRRKVIAASVYPIFIVLATFGIMILLTVFIFPKLLPLFKSVNFDLPWTTKALIFISNLFVFHGWVIAIAFIALVFLVLLMLQNRIIRFYYDRILISLPIVGSIAKGYNMTNITRTIGLLLRSGVNIVRAVKITANTTVNKAYRKELEELIEKLTKGELISSHMNLNPKLFPSITTQMVAVGESTGRLSETFMYLANMHEEEVDDLTKNLANIIEPMLLILMGVLVGFVAISIITPIYGITQHLNPK